MPVLDGPGMLREMKNTPEFNDIPAILMSSLPEIRRHAGRKQYIRRLSS